MSEVDSAHASRLMHLGRDSAAIETEAQLLLESQQTLREEISASWAAKKETTGITLEAIQFEKYKDSITPSKESAQLRGQDLRAHQERALTFSNGVMKYVEKDNGGMENLPLEMQYKVSKYLEGEEIDLGGEKISYGECYTTKLEKIDDLTKEEKVQLKELLTTLFNPTKGDLLSLNYDKITQWREKTAKEARDDESKEISLKRVENLAGAFVNEYYNKLTSHIDYEKLDKVYEAVRLHLQYEHGDTDKERENSINIFFGLSGAGKGTATDNLGIIPFISGTGGMSAPTVGGSYDIFRFATGGFDLAREGGIGVNPALNVLAAGPMLAMRMNMDKNDLEKVPMSFDGFPRDDFQIDSIFKDLNPDTVNGLFLSLKPKEAFPRNVNRVVESILKKKNIRPDSIDEIALDGKIISEADFRKLVSKYESGLADKISALSELEYLDELTNLITKELLEKGYSTNPNARFMDYKKKFPALLAKVSHDFGISVTEIMTGDLTRPEVAMVIMDLLGIDAQYSFADTVIQQLDGYREDTQNIMLLQDQILDHPDSVTISAAELHKNDYTVFDTTEGLFAGHVHHIADKEVIVITPSGSFASLNLNQNVIGLNSRYIRNNVKKHNHIALATHLNSATTPVV